MTRILAAIALLTALAGCNGGGGNFGSDNPMWGQMMGAGLGMATYQPPRPVYTSCTSYSRGQGFNCYTQ